MNAGKTIQIFLPDGDPSSIKLASITRELPQVIFVPRNKLKQAGLRNEVNRSGIYFLVEPLNDKAKPRVYVGQAENCFKRVQNHDSNKDFWQAVLAVTSTGNEFGNTAIRFLEWVCWDQLKLADKFQLENDKHISEPNTTESERADLLSYFEAIKLLLATLGYAFFEKLGKPAPNEILMCKSKHANAQGVYTNNGLTVLKGSICKLDMVDSIYGSIAKQRQDLIQEAILVQQKDAYVFAQDYPFGSPSAAAAIVLGRNANGLIEWKDQNGMTLKERLK